MSNSQVDKRSEVDKTLHSVAGDAVEMLVRWSDSSIDRPRVKDEHGVYGDQITPYKIGLFQQELVKVIASVYFGTNDRLNALEKSE